VPFRRARLDAMLSAIPALAFDDFAAKTYGPLKLLDRNRPDSFQSQVLQNLIDELYAEPFMAAVRRISFAGGAWTRRTP
jgi:hypothetical protein